MSFNKDQLNSIARRFGAFIVLIGLIVGVGLPLVHHDIVGLVIGPTMMVMGMSLLLVAWLKRPRWENRDSKR